MMGWYDGGMGAGMWTFMGVFWLALLGLIIWAVVRLSPGRDGGPQRGGSGREVDTPEEILDRRFARGEIDLEAYQVQRDALVAGRGRR